MDDRTQRAHGRTSEVKGRLSSGRRRAAGSDRGRLRSAAEKATRDAADARSQAEAAAGRQRPWLTGAIVAGAGGAAVIAGVVVDVVAGSKRPAASLCKTSGGLTLCNVAAQGPISQSDRMALAGDVTWIVGAAAVAAGVALVLVRRPAGKDATSPPPAAAYLAPTPGGVLLTGRF